MPSLIHAAVTSILTFHRGGFETRPYVVTTYNANFSLVTDF